jgi:hypothetical protein
MLWTIPRAAIVALEADVRARFELRMRQLFGADCSNGIEFAQRRGIEAERDVERFLQLWFLSNGNPEKHWAWHLFRLAEEAMHRGESWVQEEYDGAAKWAQQRDDELRRLLLGASGWSSEALRELGY